MGNLFSKNPESPVDEQRPSRRAIRDLIAVVVIGVAGTVILIQSDLHEFFSEFTDKYEVVEIDEFPLVFAVISVLFFWFSYRRWMEYRAEAQSHQETISNLCASRNHFDRVVNSVTDIVYVADAKTFHASYVNKAIETNLGFTAGEWLADPDLWYNQLHENDREVVKRTFDTGLEHGHPFTAEYRMWHKDGKRLCWFEDRVSIEHDDGGQPATLYGTMTDITAHKEAVRRITHMALFDPLTDLANRFSFRSHLDKAVARFNRENQPFSVIILDLDHFKDVNDTLGHPIGDKLLKAVSDRLMKSLRTTDTVARLETENPGSPDDGNTLARLGGDEFAIIQMELPDEHVTAALARRILDTISVPFLIEGHEIHITASAGISIYNSSQSDPDDLLREADTALYQAKENGRGKYCFFNEEINHKVQTRVLISEELHQAIERDEFILYYQPQVNIADGRIIGLEALIRWRHPERGLVPPLDFIPVAESTGQIIAIGEWALRRACEQRLEWTRQGLILHAHIAVNLSAVQIRQSDFEESFLALLDETGVEPSLIELEITENLLLEHPDRAISLIERLKDRNINFSIDDFGTGYSSLQYLKRLPVQRLKVAQEFVRDVPCDSGDVAIVTAVIGLANEFGLRSIAEGVETEEQWAILMEKGCHEIQGYYFSRPLPPEELMPALQKGRITPNGGWSRSTLRTVLTS